MGSDFHRMDMVDALRYLGALALVLALIGAAGIAMRRYGLPGMAGTGRRLSVVDSLMLGRQHRVVILRCDGTEHVLVTAPQGTTLLSSTILAAHDAKPQDGKAA
jgi:flagellar protein FliO/FliZ